MDYTERQCQLPYTIAFFLPDGILKLIAYYHRKLNKYCYEFDKPEVAHLSVKYLGYESPRLPVEHVVSKIPQIARVAEPFIPLTISLRGLDIFGENLQGEPVIYMKVLSNERLLQLHFALQREFSKVFDNFPLTEGPNFKPHITISKKIHKHHIEQIKKIVFRSKKTAKRRFRLSRLVLLTPSVIYPIISK